VPLIAPGGSTLQWDTDQGFSACHHMVSQYFYVFASCGWRRLYPVVLMFHDSVFCFTQVLNDFNEIWGR